MALDGPLNAENIFKWKSKFSKHITREDCKVCLKHRADIKLQRFLFLKKFTPWLSFFLEHPSEVTFYVQQQAVRIYGVYIQTDFLKVSRNFYKVFTGPDGLFKLSRNFYKDVYRSRWTFWNVHVISLMFTCPDGLAFYIYIMFICQDGQDTVFNKTVQFDVCIFLH